MSVGLFDAAAFESPEDAVDFIAGILESSTEYAMIATDEHGAIVLWNEGARRLYGHALADVAGLPWTFLHSGANVDAALRLAIRNGASRDGRWSGTVEHVRKDGSRFTARLVATARRDATGLLLVAHDVTDELGVAAELEDAGRANERLLAGVGHDLRSPLNAILGFTGMLLMELSGPINDEQRSHISVVQTSGRRLLTLIDDLLDLARIEAGSFEFRPAALICQEVLAGVAAGLRPLAEEKGVALDVLVPDEPLTIQTDGRSLGVILRNLADNAVRFTDEGAVRLQLAGSDSDSNGGAVARFSVSDTGCGIRDADQRRLRAALEHASRPYEGTRLGLYVCRTLARSIGATIAFESEFGRGTTFTLEVRDT